MKDPTASNHGNHSQTQIARPGFLTVSVMALSVFGWSILAHSADELELALGALKRLDYDGAATVLGHLADAGDPRAQAALATLIESGTIAPDYPVPALELLRKAAHQGLPEAALELGNRNYLGDGIIRDISRAIDWWRVAAEQGSAGAAFNLGVAYAKGAGTAIDLQTANQWFARAAHAGSQRARFALSVIQLESAKSDVALSAALASFESAATAGLPIAQYNLGSMYERGIGCETDLEKAIFWYRRAAAANIGAAQASLQRLTKLSGAEAVTPRIGIYTAQWVLSQHANNHTLQVATGSSETAIIKILERYGTNSDRAYVKVVHDEEVRYLALIGSFPSYLEAAAHLDTLEPNLRVNEPWVRRFESIQRLVRD